VQDGMVLQAQEVIGLKQKLQEETNYGVTQPQL
jgi:hypothetical protein